MVSLLTGLNMDKAKKNSLMETYTKVNIKMEGLTDLECISGLMARLSTKGLSKMDSGMVRVN